MFRVFAVLALGLGMGGGIGFLIAAANGVTLDGHDHGDHAHGSVEIPGVGHDHHDVIDLTYDAAPDLSLELTRDSMSGWNLRVETQNFRFAPEHAGQTDTPGEGHAHVYVNGEKIARLYGHWLHIPSLPENAQVEVTLNSNEHKTLRIDGVPISAVFSTDGTN